MGVAGIVTGAVALTLSGCFIIPLADGRSPFDDPWGSSTRDISEAIPPIQSALDQIELGDSWRAVAHGGSDNCEGSCSLRVDVRIEPVDVSALEPIEASDVADDEETELTDLLPAEPIDEYPDYQVPEEILRETLVAAIPVAEQHKVDVHVVSGFGDTTATGVTPSAELSEAVTSLFGGSERGAGYSAWAEEGSAEVRAYTRTHTDVLHEMGLE